MGIVTDVMPVQPEKAKLSIDVMVVEMTIAPLEHAPPWEFLSTQSTVASSDNLLLADATVSADVVPPPCCSNFFFCPTILLCSPLCEEEKEAKEAETEEIITGKKQLESRTRRRRKSPARPFRGGLLEVVLPLWWR